ncbi:MAG: hypothetical protein A2749_00600 [Parcubacteria group bacterium RIFCSPHIGHO2_01_FULL_45_26]|nr:MAG: hypothetical protein A2749_00600 [Parcubacteria group bacterium RIFCSPHIGHO2_01_FULL_45_26]
MNKELSEVLKIYSTDTHESFTNRLAGSSKETIISIFTDLLTTYINDHNSSTLREYLTVTIAGYEHSEGKIGFNGFKQTSIVGGKSIACEAKPKNFNTEDLLDYKEGNRKRKPAPLNGNGNFTDYTLSRFKRDKKENPHMLVSGFTDGRLVYILEFPFKHKSFIDKLNKQLNKYFPSGKHTKGSFLRSANFDYKDYIFSRDLKIIFLLSKKELLKCKDYINRKFFTFLYEKST